MPAICLVGPKQFVPTGFVAISEVVRGVWAVGFPARLQSRAAVRCRSCEAGFVWTVAYLEFFCLVKNHPVQIHRSVLQTD